jgi:hypothetical protein
MKTNRQQILSIMALCFGLLDALVSAKVLDIFPYHAANDAQRDDHTAKVNTVAVIDTTVSFYSWIC